LTLLGEAIVVQCAVVSEQGEDSFAMCELAGGTLLCVTDGCGGLGSRRYESLDGRTGAYLASRLAARTMQNWAEERMQVPVTAAQGQQMLEELQQDFQEVLSSFAKKYCEDAGVRIVGSMQRVLPTTLCAAMAEAQGQHPACCMIWAGDSRGYTLDENGLHQHTVDDVRGEHDAFDSLYLDLPLSNFLSADKPVQLHMRRFPLAKQGMLICATDGVYSAIANPMELEMLLLDAMQRAKDSARWQKRVETQLRSVVQDDATLLCCPYGFDHYDAMKQYFAPRHERLKRAFITPVRRKKRDHEAVRGYWLAYAKDYNRMEETEHDGQDWRI